MDVYLLVIYMAVVFVAAGAVLLKIGDIFEQRRDRKYYRMIRDDAGFWQMKAEQSGKTIGEFILDYKYETIRKMTEDD